MWRNLAIALIALTGVGLIYLAARTYFIKNNHRGIVVNYNAGAESGLVEELVPGVHILLSPFREFQQEISTQYNVQKLGTFPVKTRDNVDANIQADFTYQILNPKKAFSEVKNFDDTLMETVKGAYSSAIQGLNYREINSSSINALALAGGHREEEGHHPDEFSNAPAERGDLFFKRLIDLCSGWGVKIINFRIISVEAKHARVSESLELTAVAELTATAQATAANSQARTIETLALAQKSAQMIRAEASLGASECLRGDGVAFDLNTQENNIRAAAELGQGKNNLVLGFGSNAGSLARSPMSIFSTPDQPRRDRARSPDVLAMPAQKM